MSFTRAFFLVSVCIISIVSCTPPVTLTPTAIPASPTLSPTNQPFVAVALFGEAGHGALTAPVGSVVTITLAFRPSQRTAIRASDGTLISVTTDWQNHTVAQMRYCIGQNCTLPNAWQTFSTPITLPVPVDWVGLREYSITAQFRDGRGDLVPASDALTDRATPTLPITGIINTRTPMAAPPPVLQTTIARAATAFPVVGKIQVGERPIVGAKAGSTLEIKVRFEATSPHATVNAMRVKFDRLGRCLTPEEMNDALWEPVVAEKIFPTRVALNWTSFKVHVQYRDAANHLSPVYCGEIAIEGRP